MLAELRVGPQMGGDGSSPVMRAAKTGEAITAIAHGIYYEPSSRAGIFMVANQAGITTQAGISATTPALTLYNPKNSGVNAAILYAGCIASVAFAAASVIFLAANTNIAAADVTGTATTAHRCGLLGNGKQPSVVPLLAATLPAAPVGVAIIGVGLTGAITTAPTGQTLGRYFDGTLILSPGSAISFQTSTASGTNGFFGEIVWEEIVIV